MMRGDLPIARKRLWCRLAVGVLLMYFAASLCAQPTPQADADVPPDATPTIQQIDPNQAAPGAHVTVVIQGSNFSAGAYVSSISAAIHVESSKRVSATQLEAQLSISVSAQPSTVSLLVSNPASRAAETAFKIVAGQAPSPSTPPQSVEPPKPAPPAAPSAPPAPSAPAAPTPPAPEVQPSAPSAPPAPSAPAAPPAPAQPPAPPAPSAPPGPEVTTIEPARVGPGFDMDLKITGKNFVQGAKVSFANTGIRVMGVTSTSSTELTAPSAGPRA